MIKIADGNARQEIRDRLHLERKVERAFFEAGKALMELRDRRLYRSTLTGLPIINQSPMNPLSTYVKHQNNRSMLIQDPVIRERVKKIAQELIGGYEPEIR